MSNSKRAKLTAAQVSERALAWRQADAILRLAEMSTTRCALADRCALDTRCPFVRDCRAAEEDPAA